MYRKARAAHSNNTGKYKILTEIDEWEMCVAISCKYRIRKQTLSRWIRENLKLWWSRQKQNSGEKTEDEKSSLEKRQRMGKAASKDFDSFLQMALKSWSQKHTCKWEHAESWGIVFWELGPPDKSQVSDGWLGRWKIRFTVSIKTISGTVTK